MYRHFTGRFHCKFTLCIDISSGRFMYKHFIWYRFHVRSVTTGYVSPLQTSSNGTSEPWPLDGEKKHGPPDLCTVCYPSVSPIRTHR